MKNLIIILLLIPLVACDAGVKQLGATEYGVRFRKLPPTLGGGLASRVRLPGEMVFVWPWDRIYVLDTRIRNIEWGAQGKGSNKTHSDYVQTRASDGNEVSLAVRIQYSITKDPKVLRNLVQTVGTTNEEIEAIIVAAARADLRTYMNKLKTAEFFDNKAKYRGESEVLTALKQRLGGYGINVHSVNLKEHRFERVLLDGTVDRSYQERINQVQTLMQETERENLRKETVIADKKREKNNTQAMVNRLVAEADGYKEQSKFRGDAYQEARINNAEAVLAAGKAEVEGIREQVKALSGPGGNAILKLELAHQLLKNNPQFIVLQQPNKSDGIAVNRIDTNELLDQIGILEGLKEKNSK